jgi:hypothetical protein
MRILVDQHFRIGNNVRVRYRTLLCVRMTEAVNRGVPGWARDATAWGVSSTPTSARPHSMVLRCRLARAELDHAHRASHPPTVNQYTAASRGDHVDAADASGE